MYGTCVFHPRLATLCCASACRHRLITTLTRRFEHNADVQAGLTELACSWPLIPAPHDADVVSSLVSRLYLTSNLAHADPRPDSNELRVRSRSDA
jgi:hypothetical protein